MLKYYLLLVYLNALVCCNQTEWNGKSYIHTPDFVETVDGVEYVNAEERNATMLMVLGQTFFNNIQQNLTDLLLQEIVDKLQIKKLNLHMSMPGILAAQINFTDIGFSNLHLDTKGYDIMTLEDDYAVFETRDFTSTLSASYSMITEPAILGDFGALSFDSGNQTLVIGSHAEVTDDGHLQIELRQFEMLSTDFALVFDGLADIPDIMGRFISFTGNVLRSRLMSIIKYLGPSGWQNGINKVLSLIPDQIHIPFTNLTMEGGLSKGIKVVKNQYARIPMDVSLQQEHRVLNVTNIANFDEVTNDGYQFCGGMSDYIMNSFIDPIYELGIFKYNASIAEVTTTWIDAALVLQNGLKGDITKYGWDLGMPCVSIIRVVDPAPEVRVREAYGASFLMKVDVDIQCKKHNDSTEFSELFTLESAPINITSTNFTITDKLKMTFEVDPFTIDFDNVKDSQVGHVGTGVLNFISKEFSTIIYKSMNVAGKMGIPLQLILDILHLKFIDAHDTQIKTKDGYFELCSNPWFNFTKQDDSEWEGVQNNLNWVMNTLFASDNGENEISISPDLLYSIADSLDSGINQLPRVDVNDLNGDKVWLEKMNSASLVRDTLSEAIQSVLSIKDHQYQQVSSNFSKHFDNEYIK